MSGINTLPKPTIISNPDCNCSAVEFSPFHPTGYSLQMDEKTVESLESAYKVTPENMELLQVVLRARLERSEPAAARDLLDGIEPSQLLESDQRVLAGRVCEKARDPEGVLRFVTEDSAEELLLRAKALLVLEKLDEGRDAYERAVASNPALEDPQLAKHLTAKIRVFPSSGEAGKEGERKLRVYATDDTDDLEVQRLLNPAEETVTFDDVGGLETIKKTIRKKIILPFQKPRLFQRFKKKVGGGILLYGPPGCGKTLLARATAGECKAQFFNVTISDILDMWIGESEHKLHAIFEKARQSTPAVLFFDELEGLGGKRQYSREATSSKLVSQFLSELDGFAQNNEGVLILGATNVPWAIDPAFRRPGRFDRVLFVPPPDNEARSAILEILLREKPIQGDLDVRFLAKNTSGFSGADLHNLVETATDGAIDASIEQEEEVPLSAKHLKEALKEVKQTTVEWLTTARNYARYANEGGQYDDVLEFLRKHGK
jgi:SpoVK/Ycf46/Vps4 family AAA+-type ATPase